MSLDKSRTRKLSDSSRKFVMKKQRKSMNSTFAERTEKTRKKKGKKVAGRKVEKRTQRASKKQNTKFELEIHPTTL